MINVSLVWGSTMAGDTSEKRCTWDTSGKCWAGDTSEKCCAVGTSEKRCTGDTSKKCSAVGTSEKRCTAPFMEVVGPLLAGLLSSNVED